MPHTNIITASQPYIPAIRFLPVMHLHTGQTHTLLAETDKRFEERAVFGRAAIATESGHGGSPSPAAWLAEQVETVAIDAHYTASERPIIIPAPLAAMADEDVALACNAAIRRTNLCAQEICIEISDAALAAPGLQTQRSVEALRRFGFRVSLDATKSWQSPLSAAMRLLFESMRIDARHLNYEAELENRIDAAVMSGMTLIAEHAAWRDGDYLSSLGIDYCLRPRLDA